MKSSNKGVDNKVLKSSTIQSASGYYASNSAGTSQSDVQQIKKQNQKSHQNAGKPGSSGSLS